jgi:hypothetical protein
MPEFEIRYSEVEMFTAYFHAENEKEAREVAENLRTLDWDDIEGWYSKRRDFDLEIDLDSLKQLD